MAFADVTQTTVATELVPTIVGRDILEEAGANVVIAPLIRQEYGLVGRPGHTLTIPKWAAVTATSVSEATDLTNTAINPTNASFTVGEVGIMSTLTDYLLEADILPALTQDSEYAQLHGRALARAIDTDIAALFASLNTGSAIGTSGTDITLNNFLEAMYTLDAANAPGAKVCVLHPVQYHHVRKAMQSATGIVWGGRAEFVRNGQVDRLFGVDTYQTSICPAGATSVDKCGAMFVRDAMAMVHKWEPKVEFERNASLRAWEMVTTACYAVGELADTYGVSIQTDATM